VNVVLTELSVSGENKKWPGPFFENLSDPWRRRSPSVSQGLVSQRSGLGLGGYVSVSWVQVSLTSLTVDDFFLHSCTYYFVQEYHFNLYSVDMAL